MAIGHLFKLKEVKSIDVNSAELVYKHREILNKKPVTQKVFKEFYDECRRLNKLFFGETQGIQVELGSGSSLFKNFYPEIVATDYKDYKGIDQVLDATSMDLANESVRAFYGINCFHHFLEPNKFFNELHRTLKPGGGCILIEPYHSVLSSFLHNNMHASEYYDKKQNHWDNPHYKGPMEGANQALSYIIFFRDREIFKIKYPNLEIVYSKPFNNFLLYLLSGGVNFISLVPSFLIPVVRFVEYLLTPFKNLLALHYVVVIRKKNLRTPLKTTFFPKMSSRTNVRDLKIPRR